MDEVKSLVLLGRSCFEVLRKAKTTYRSRSEGDVRIDNVLNRLLIWAGAIGFFAPGSAGIESRFQDDDEGRDMVLQLLERLYGSAQQVASRSENLQYIAGDVSQVEPASKDLDHDNKSVSALALSHVEETVDMLYRFLNLMRKTSSQPTQARVLEYKKKHVDIETDVEFEDWLRWYIRETLPGLHQNGVLSQRIIDTALYRHWKVMYKERHAQKLAQNVLEALQPTEKKDESNDATLKQSDIPQIRVEAPTDQRGDKNKKKVVAFSDTLPSVVNALKVPFAASSKAPSVVSRSEMARHGHLPIPKAPQPIHNGSHETICPYCSNFIGPEIYGDSSTARHRWSRHLLHDLTPFICTADTCEQASEAYATTERWIAHLQAKHTSLYCCKSEGHEHYTFDEQDGLRRHFSEEHPGDFEPDEIEDILDEAAVPSMDISPLLIGYDPSDPEHIAPLCRLCSQDVTVDSDTNFKSLISHAAGHFEEMAIACLLADCHDDDEKSSNTRMSEDFNKADRPSNGLEEVRPRSLFYNADYEALVSSGIALDDILEKKDDDLLSWDRMVLEFRKSSAYSVDDDKTVQSMLEARDRSPPVKTFVWGRFAFLYSRHSDPAYIPVLRPKNAESGIVLHGDVQGDRYTKVVREWYQDCAQNHPECRSRASYTPNRLLHFERLEGELWCQLYDTNGESCPPYAVISHQWGTKASEVSKLTTETVHAFYSWRLSSESLDPLLNDCLSVAAELGLEYAWVDCLCIIQDNTADWLSIAPQIAQIFAASQVCIAACDSYHSQDLVSRAPYMGLRAIQLPRRGRAGRSGLAIDDGSLETELRAAAWATAAEYDEQTSLWTRAWTAQERLFPSRLIAFKEKRIQWQCRRHFRSNDFFLPYEVEGLRKLQPFARSPLKRQNRRTIYHTQWLALITEFSQGKLTRKDDKLPAIASIAREFHTVLPDDIYLAGLWSEDMINGLAWFGTDDTVQFQGDWQIFVPPESTWKLDQSGHGPSWSWISADGPVRFAGLRWTETWKRPDVRHGPNTRSDSIHAYMEVQHREMTLIGQVCAIDGRVHRNDLAAYFFLGVEDAERDDNHDFGVFLGMERIKVDDTSAVQYRRTSFCKAPLSGFSELLPREEFQIV